MGEIFAGPFALPQECGVSERASPDLLEMAKVVTHAPCMETDRGQEQWNYGEATRARESVSFEYMRAGADH